MMIRQLGHIIDSLFRPIITKRKSKRWWGSTIPPIS